MEARLSGYTADPVRDAPVQRQGVTGGEDHVVDRDERLGVIVNRWIADQRIADDGREDLPALAAGELNDEDVVRIVVGAEGRLPAGGAGVDIGGDAGR